MSTAPTQHPTLRQRVAAEQLRAHYSMIPAMVVAPVAGGLFTAWVLWDAVRNDILVIGMAALLVLSALRLLVHRRYFAAPSPAAAQRRWRLLAVAAALLSGCLWGSAALFLYPPHAPECGVYLLILLTLLPIVPVAALAVYMPAFYAYYFPCIVPFVLMLSTAGSRAEQLAAALLVMMALAMLAFARRYSRGLAQAIALKLQLAEQSEALQRAIRHKRHFIAAASHDLRQPVHAMGLFVQSLQRDAAALGLSDEVRHIDASLRSLRVMLDDMLEVSRLDADVVTPHEFDFDVGELLRGLRDEYAALAAHQHLQFRLRVQPAAVHSDPTLLERMLRNLLSNALKFTRRGGIALVCRGRGNAVRLQVIDTGSGIRAAHLDRVFDEFTQIDGAERDRAKGLGLGLAIVQRLAALMNHTVDVRSVYGRGSVFTIGLPRGAGPPRPLSAPAPSVPLVAPLPCRVLVIDDDAAAGASTAALLRRWGHSVLLARSAAQAEEAVRSGGSAADMLIVDYRLADGESGLDAIARLERGAGRKLPALIVTGDTAAQCIRECHAAGMTLLHKPVDPRKLMACMAALLGTMPGSGAAGWAASAAAPAHCPPVG